jgi:hypothetical protein
MPSPVALGDVHACALRVLGGPLCWGGWGGSPLGPDAVSADDSFYVPTPCLRCIHEPPSCPQVLAMTDSLASSRLRALFPIALAALAFALASTGPGCVVEPRRTLGGQCDLTSECQAPLVCRYSYCRRECLSSRDCGLGLRCLLAEDGLGVCQLPEEKRCSINSDCVEGLYCTSGECTNACVTDRDCLNGICVSTGGFTSCEFPEQAHCEYDSECTDPMVCVSQECRFECAADIDCGPGLACVVHPGCQRPCACRRPCETSDECPEAGTECVDAREGAEIPSFCDRAVRTD